MKNDKHTIICLGAGDSQLPIIKSAKQLGLNVIAIDRDPNAIGFGIADEKIIISTYNSNEVIEELFKFQNLYSFNGLVARVSGPALYTAAKISETFDLPGLTHDLIPLATEKAALREFCEKNNFRMPKGRKFAKGQTNELDLSYPIIVKPDYPLIGKKNITIVYEPQNLAEIIDSACDSSANDLAEIEEYIEGIDVSVLFKLSNGKVEIISLWDELVGVDEKFQICGLGVGIPSVVDNSMIRKKVEKLVSEFTIRLNKTIHSILILSLRITKDGNIFIIELHADLGGDLIAEILLPKSNPKFDFFKLAVEYSIKMERENSIIKFAPIILLYSNELYDSYIEKEGTSQVSYFIIKDDSIKSNLSRANTFFESLKLSASPLHYLWFIKNKISMAKFN